MLQVILDKINDYTTNKLRIMNWYSTRSSVRFMKQYFNTKPLVGAEIGVLRGANSLNILRNLNIDTLYLIDPYLLGSNGLKTTAYESFKIARVRLRPYKDKIVFIKKKSVDAVDDVLQQLDFLYIDSSHFYADTIAELVLYYPQIKKGGVLCGHDFDIPDVAHAVTEFANNNNLKVSAYGYPTDWWIVL